jgi:hypothetical protein
MPHIKSHSNKDKNSSHSTVTFISDSGSTDAGIAYIGKKLETDEISRSQLEKFSSLLLSYLIGNSYISSAEYVSSNGEQATNNVSEEEHYTFSEIKNYLPFAQYFSNNPDDKIPFDRVIQSDHFIPDLAKLLAALYITGENDGHNGNIGINPVTNTLVKIDHDQNLWFYTYQKANFFKYRYGRLAHKKLTTVDEINAQNYFNKIRYDRGFTDELMLGLAQCAVSANDIENLCTFDTNTKFLPLHTPIDFLKHIIDENTLVAYDQDPNFINAKFETFIKFIFMPPALLSYMAKMSNLKANDIRGLIPLIKDRIARTTIELCQSAQFQTYWKSNGYVALANVRANFERFCCEYNLSSPELNTAFQTRSEAVIRKINAHSSVEIESINSPLEEKDNSVNSLTPDETSNGSTSVSSDESLTPAASQPKSSDTNNITIAAFDETYYRTKIRKLCEDSRNASKTILDEISKINTKKEVIDFKQRYQNSDKERNKIKLSYLNNFIAASQAFSQEMKIIDTQVASLLDLPEIIKLNTQQNTIVSSAQDCINQKDTIIKLLATESENFTLKIKEYINAKNQILKSAERLKTTLKIELEKHYEVLILSQGVKRGVFSNKWYDEFIPAIKKEADKINEYLVFDGVLTNDINILVAQFNGYYANTNIAFNQYKALANEYEYLAHLFKMLENLNIELSQLVDEPYAALEKLTYLQNEYSYILNAISHKNEYININTYDKIEKECASKMNDIQQLVLDYQEIIQKQQFQQTLHTEENTNTNVTIQPEQLENIISTSPITFSNIAVKQPSFLQKHKKALVLAATIGLGIAISAFCVFFPPAAIVLGIAALAHTLTIAGAAAVVITGTALIGAGVGHTINKCVIANKNDIDQIDNQEISNDASYKSNVFIGTNTDGINSLLTTKNNFADSNLIQNHSSVDSVDSNHLYNSASYIENQTDQFSENLNYASHQSENNDENMNEQNNSITTYDENNNESSDDESSSNINYMTIDDFVANRTAHAKPLTKSNYKQNKNVLYNNVDINKTPTQENKLTKNTAPQYLAGGIVTQFNNRKNAVV